MLGEWYLPPGECQVILPIKKVPFPFPTTLSSPFRQGSLKPRFCKQIARTHRNPPGPRIRRSEPPLHGCGEAPRHTQVGRWQGDPRRRPGVRQDGVGDRFGPVSVILVIVMSATAILSLRTFTSPPPPGTSSRRSSACPPARTARPGPHGTVPFGSRLQYPHPGGTHRPVAAGAASGGAATAGLRGGRPARAPGRSTALLI